MRRKTDFLAVQNLSRVVLLFVPLAGLGELVEDADVIPYAEIPHFPVATSVNHVSRQVFPGFRHLFPLSFLLWEEKVPEPFKWVTLSLLGTEAVRLSQVIIGFPCSWKSVHLDFRLWVASRIKNFPSRQRKKETCFLFGSYSLLMCFVIQCVFLCVNTQMLLFAEFVGLSYAALARTDSKASWNWWCFFCKLQSCSFKRRLHQLEAGRSSQLLGVSGAGRLSYGECDITDIWISTFYVWIRKEGFLQPWVFSHINSLLLLGDR